MNSKEVREAFHVSENVKEFISQNNQMVYLQNWEASSFIHDILYKYGYKMLHIMGDTDGLLSTVGLQKWMKKTGWKVT